MGVAKRRGKWWVDISLPGGQRIRRVSPVQTKGGALAFEAEVRAELASSTSTSCSDERASTVRVEEPPSSAPTLDAFARDWLTTYALVNNKASTVIGKEGALRNHLLPFFGNRRLDEIGPRDIERYKAFKLEGAGRRKPLNPKTINNHLTVLRKLLSTAVEWGALEHAPKIRLLRVTTHHADWLTREDSRRFLAAVAEHYSQWTPHFWVALRTGLRRGEIFALRWMDVDFDASAVHVRHSVFRGRLESPKNGRTRTVPMSRQLREVLAGYRAEVGGATRRLVFPGADGRLTTHQDHIDRPLKGALKAAGLRTSIRFHDLRHSFASQLIAAGRSIKEVQELLGHASIQTTMRYAHLAPERMRDAVASLDDA